MSTRPTGEPWISEQRRADRAFSRLFHLAALSAEIRRRTRTEETGRHPERETATAKALPDEATYTQLRSMIDEDLERRIS